MPSSGEEHPNKINDSRAMKIIPAEGIRPSGQGPLYEIYNGDGMMDFGSQIFL